MNPPLPLPAPADPSHWATTVVIPATWMPEQALAVLELLDDLREKLAALYLDQMQAHLRQQQRGNDSAVDQDADAGAASDDFTF
jgi:hypothetical protein